MEEEIPKRHFRPSETSSMDIEVPDLAIASNFESIRKCKSNIDRLKGKFVLYTV